MSEDRVIGQGDGMPWHVPDEYQHFLDTTRDASLILGRKSFEIFGATLTSARCYVVTRNPEQIVGGIPVESVAAAITSARSYPDTIFVGGGGRIYRQGIELADGMLLSVIPGDWSGDTSFPEFDVADWRVLCAEDRGTYLLTQYERHGGHP